MSFGPFHGISFLSLASISFALQIQIPDENHIFQGQNTTVILRYEEGDPNDILLKKIRLKHNNNAPNDAIHVANFTVDAQVNITFNHTDKYQIFAYENTSVDIDSSDPIAQTSVLEVHDNSKDHSHHGSDKGLIVGAVLGSVAVIVIVLLTVYLIFFRSRRRRSFQDRLVRHSDTPASSFVQYLYAKYPPRRNPGSRNHGGSLPPVYITPSPTSARTSFGHSMATKSTASFWPKPLTDRQMDIQGRLHSLQEKLLKLEGTSRQGRGDIEAAENESEILDTKAKIGTLKDFMESPWALNVTDVVPPELVHCFTSY